MKHNKLRLSKIGFFKKAKNILNNLLNKPTMSVIYEELPVSATLNFSGFKLYPNSEKSPYIGVRFIPSEQSLYVLQKTKLTKPFLVEKIDMHGMPVPSNKPGLRHQMERKTSEVYDTFEIFNPEDIKDFLKKNVRNYNSFDFDYFLSEKFKEDFFDKIKEEEKREEKLKKNTEEGLKIVQSLKDVNSESATASTSLIS